ncbi:helix-turn-helix domain-containing protein [Methylobacterium sp. BTF04]|uniref:helix-turn-helix domain-containing protein n=1 Tax=Methylobacterium sp. BTF04 TaxID=2708300 RepID=UPI0013D2D087|nr:helix-turn-helix domain-containing protein [Methylobacterium sp. BTF04]NEU14632.1 helix-turn-helix domain-containing protein [Methylobacterium sp. BTF04]
MKPLAHIRKNVLDLSQAEFARIAGVSQGTVSRWEKGELSPSLPELLLIRAAAKARSPNWDDCWLFDAPSQQDMSAHA